MKVIITGATGMVGMGVLLACINSEEVSEVLLIGRSPHWIAHQKVKEKILSDFLLVNALQDDLLGYDACFYCMGVTSIGKDENEYTTLTYEPVKAFVDTLLPINPHLVFNYVSGTGTDSSEKGNSMWARVKGKTENYILQAGFKDAYMFRPGFIIPENGIRSRTRWVQSLLRIIRPLFPIFKKMNSVTTTSRIGNAMIYTVNNSWAIKHLESKDINTIAKNFK